MKAFLRWSERALRTDTTYLARNGFWVSSAYAIHMAGGMLLAVWLANVLTPTSFGVYQFFLAAVGALGAVTLSGMGTALMRAAAQGNTNTLQYAVRTKLLWSLGSSVIALGLAGYYATQGNLGYSYVLILIACCVPLIESFSLYQPFLSGREAFATVTWYSLWRKGFPLAATGGAAFFTRDPLLVVSVYLVSQLGIIFILYVFTTKKHSSFSHSDASLLNYGLHLSAMNVISRITQYADMLLIYTLLGPASLAVYAVAKLPVQYVGGALKSLRSLFLPKLAQRSYSTLQKTLPRKVLLVSLLALLLCVLYILSAPYIFNVLFPNFGEAVLYSQIIALTLLGLPRAIYSQALAAHKRVKELYWLKSVPPLVHLGVMTVAIPLYGISGAILALLCYEITTAAMTYRLFATGTVEPNEDTDYTYA